MVASAVTQTPVPATPTLPRPIFETSYAPRPYPIAESLADASSRAAAGAGAVIAESGIGDTPAAPVVTVTVLDSHTQVANASAVSKSTVTLTLAQTTDTAVPNPIFQSRIRTHTVLVAATVPPSTLPVPITTIEGGWDRWPPQLGAPGSIPNGAGRLTPAVGAVLAASAVGLGLVVA